MKETPSTEWKRRPLRRNTLALAFLIVMAVTVERAAAGAEPARERQDQLLSLLRQDCGSCHGLTMKGGLGPPLLPQFLSGKNDDDLVDAILNGRDGTPMPPWNPFLSESEARWLVGVLKKGEGAP